MKNKIVTGKRIILVGIRLAVFYWVTKSVAMVLTWLYFRDMAAT